MLFRSATATQLHRVKTLAHLSIIASGYWQVSLASDYCSIIRNPDLTGDAKWVVRAEWDDFIASDPVRTKAEGVSIAHQFIAERRAGRNAA
mgnify:FL=1